MNDRACASVIGYYRDYEAIPNQCFRKASFSVVDSTYAGYPFRIFLILQALSTKAPDCCERSLSIQPNILVWLRNEFLPSAHFDGMSESQLKKRQ